MSGSALASEFEVDSTNENVTRAAAAAFLGKIDVAIPSSVKAFGGHWGTLDDSMFKQDHALADSARLCMLFRRVHETYDMLLVRASDTTAERIQEITVLDLLHFPYLSEPMEEVKVAWCVHLLHKTRHNPNHISFCVQQQRIPRPIWNRGSVRSKVPKLEP